MKKVIGLIAFLSISTSLNAMELIKVGQMVDVRLHQYSDKDIGWLGARTKEDCIYLGKNDDLYVFKYDGDIILVPVSSIKWVQLK